MEVVARQGPCGQSVQLQVCNRSFPETLLVIIDLSLSSYVCSYRCMLQGLHLPVYWHFNKGTA